MRSGWEALQHRVDGGQQQIVVRRRLDPCANAERLSPREYQVVSLAAVGLASKQIAAEIRLSATAVRAILNRAMRKLDLRACSQVPAFWYGLGEEPTLSQDGFSEVLIFDTVLAPSEPAEGLTLTERSVLLQVIRGENNREIAAKRGTSARTVANQVAVLFKKFGASSRAELAARSLSVDHRRRRQLPDQHELLEMGAPDRSVAFVVDRPEQLSNTSVERVELREPLLIRDRSELTVELVQFE
jgi:DNA-binding CsgD family transcriptional regulator